MKRALGFLTKFLGIADGLDSPFGEDLDEDTDWVFKYRYDARMDGLGSPDSSETGEEDSEGSHPSSQDAEKS